jgi:acyl-CoA ligase (AMP-forming) (exosortase A-associated)
MHMPAAVLLPDFVSAAVRRAPDAVAVTHGDQHTSYELLQAAIYGCVSGLMALGVGRGDRVGIYFEKRREAVVASFGCGRTDTMYGLLDPLLKPEHIVYIQRDRGVSVLVTSTDRAALLAPSRPACLPLLHVVITDRESVVGLGAVRGTAGEEVLVALARARDRVIDTDVLAILYTSGSKCKPKGGVLTHRNLEAGAESVGNCVESRPSDALRAVLSLSFDAGFSQLTTAFCAGARMVLLNDLLPRDFLKALEREKVTGLTAVRPLHMQFSWQPWPAVIGKQLRHRANTGGRMPRETLQALRKRVPKAKPFVIFGLNEVLLSTYLPPAEVDLRPDSIGKAIPNAEFLVLREDGSECGADASGELVHPGALADPGCWGDAEKTAERYGLLPEGIGGRQPGLQRAEYVVFSGDTVRRDAEGLLDCVGRRDEVIRASGYLVSLTEVEEVLCATRLVVECVAFGVENAALERCMPVIATAPDESDAVEVEALTAACCQRMPAHMLPAGVDGMSGPLPRNPKGKINCKLLATASVDRHESAHAG